MSEINSKSVDNSIWHNLLANRINRRSLFKGAAIAGIAAAAGPIEMRTAAAASTSANDSVGLTKAGEPIDPTLFFKPIAPSTEDKFLLPEGFSQQVFAAWNEDIGNGQTVGFNHDFTAFFPIDMLEKGYGLSRAHRGWNKPDMSSSEGILAINHEYVNSLFVSKYDGKNPKTAEQIKTEQQAVGMSFLRIKKGSDSQWSIVKGDAFTRRYDATSPAILTGPAAELDGGPNAIGTLANCSGGVTPWGTTLSCEENFQDYGTPAADGGYGWDSKTYAKRHYGYVVEIDPFDPKALPRKHTAMGRFRHENVAIRIADDGTVVAYMGDDRADSCVYKFVSSQKLSTPRNRAGNLKILEKGKLYVADFGSGKWILLDYDSSEALKGAKDKDGKPIFSSQADVLADARTAALTVKGTPVDRPEDIEIHPKDGSVYIALTNNTGHGNFHGQIVQLVEKGNAPTATSFEWEIFAVGGKQSGFSSPDNLIFDEDGNLWMVTDISSSRVGKGIYTFQGNNAMFMMRTEGPYRGIAYQFASGPNQCEMTGQCWTPDGNTMFLSVQHPGEESESLEKLSSNWPRGEGQIPQPAIVAITGKWKK